MYPIKNNYAIFRATFVFIFKAIPCLFTLALHCYGVPPLCPLLLNITFVSGAAPFRVPLRSSTAYSGTRPSRQLTRIFEQYSVYLKWVYIMYAYSRTNRRRKKDCRALWKRNRINGGKKLKFSGVKNILFLAVTKKWVIGWPPPTKACAGRANH